MYTYNFTYLMCSGKAMILKRLKMVSNIVLLETYPRREWKVCYEVCDTLMMWAIRHIYITQSLAVVHDNW